MTRAPAERPALRPLDARRVHTPAAGFLLHDPFGISAPAFVPLALLPIVRRLDGCRSVGQIRAEAAAEFAGELPLSLVQDVVRQLDELTLLQGPCFDRAVAAAAAAFVAAGERPPSHAGSAGYPDDPTALRAALQRMVRAPVGPVARLCGLVAPHLDLARGHAGYRAAYERLAAAPLAELYVLFGTGHAGPRAPVTGLPLDWRTPLGTVRTDRDYVDAVHAELGAASPTDLLLHRDEHSLELQVLLLQHVHDLRRAPPPLVAGFLCGALPSQHGDPLREAYGRRLVAAFRRAAPGRRVCFLAGADLAHIGPVFGDAAPIDDARLATLRTAEASHLQHLVAGQPGAFHRVIAGCGNPDRVCSAPAITLCAALAGGPAELLHYGQARAADDSQTVSFCALAFAGSPAAGE